MAVAGASEVHGKRAPLENWSKGAGGKHGLSLAVKIARPKRGASVAVGHLCQMFQALLIDYILAVHGSNMSMVHQCCFTVKRLTSHYPATRVTLMQDLRAAAQRYPACKNLRSTPQ